MDSERYALLVVDMQNGFCHQEGSFPKIGRGLEDAMEAVANAAVAVGQARSAGLPVVFTRHVYRPGRPDEGAALVRSSPAWPAWRRAPGMPTCATNSAAPPTTSWWTRSASTRSSGRRSSRCFAA